MNTEHKQIVIYNCETKQVIYIFVGYAACSKLLFPKESKQYFTKKIRYHMEIKKKLMCDFLGFEIAIRKASEAQITLLGTEDYIKL